MSKNGQLPGSFRTNAQRVIFDVRFLHSVLGLPLFALQLKRKVMIATEVTTNVVAVVKNTCEMCRESFRTDTDTDGGDLNVNKLNKGRFAVPLPILYPRIPCVCAPNESSLCFLIICKKQERATVLVYTFQSNWQNNGLGKK